MQLLQTIGDTINSLNPGLFDNYSVNGIQLASGEVVSFNDQKEKKYIGISDINGTAFYIRVEPSVTASPTRKISSLARPNVDVINCRLVAYSFNKSLVSETLCNKLKTDLGRIMFQSVAANKPVITVRRSNTNYIDNFLTEVRKETFDPGDSFICVSIDFELRYVPDECDTCVPVNSDYAYVIILDQDDNEVTRKLPGTTYPVLVFSGISGGNASTVYTNSIVGGTA